MGWPQKITIASHLRFRWHFVNTMDFPPLHDESAVPFLSTGNQAISPPQLSLASCLSPDGTIDVDKYRCYAASRLAKARGRSEEILRRTIFDGGESHAASVEQQCITKKSRRSRCVLGRKDTEDGPLCVITPEQSGWYHAYVCNFLLEDPDSFMAKKFRTRFRLPYPSYKDLLHQITSDNRFERWCARSLATLSTKMVVFQVVLTSLCYDVSTIG